MTKHTIPDQLDSTGRLDIEVRRTPPGETSPAWEIVGHRTDGDQTHFNGDVTIALFALVADLTLSRDIDRISVTIWLPE